MMDWILDENNIILIVLVVVGVVLIAGLMSSSNMVSTLTSNKQVSQLLGVYYLPETVFKLLVNSTVQLSFNEDDRMIEAKVIDQNFDISYITQTDTSQTYYIKYNSNYLSNHEIELSVNENGLLENVVATSDSRISQVIATLTESPKQVFDADKSGSRIVDVKDLKTKAVRYETREFEKSFSIRASKTLEPNNEVPWIINLSSKNGGGDKELNAGFKFVTKITNSSSEEIQTIPKISKGLLFRPRVNATLKIIPIDMKDQSSEHEVSFIDPNNAYVVPIKSTLFVRRTHEISMTNGELVSHKLSNPSAVEGFIKIPINIAKAIVSIPTQLISFRIDTLNKRKEFIDAQKYLSDSELKLDKTILSYETEISVQRLDNEQSLLEADKKIEKAKKELIEFKLDTREEIERLQKELRKHKD